MGCCHYNISCVYKRTSSIQKIPFSLTAMVPGDLSITMLNYGHFNYRIIHEFIYVKVIIKLAVIYEKNPEEMTRGSGECF